METILSGKIEKYDLEIDAIERNKTDNVEIEITPETNFEKIVGLSGNAVNKTLGFMK